MPITYESLWNKSKVLIEKAIARRNEGAFDDFQLNAALALEILAKATLAKKHPVLVADPTHFESVLIACGESKSSDCRTIQATTLFKRCVRLVPGFGESDEKFCMTMADRRNAELHSGAVPFAGIRIDAWQPKYWRVVELLTSAQGRPLDDLLGGKEAQAAQEIVKDASRALAKAIEGRIGQHKNRFETDYAEPTRAAIRKQSGIAARAKLTSFSTEMECPACACTAVLEGSYLDEVDVGTEMVEDPNDYHYEGAPSWVHLVEKTYESERLDCYVCGLRLNGTDEIAAAGVTGEFTRVDEKDVEYEEEYGNC